MKRLGLLVSLSETAALIKKRHINDFRSAEIKNTSRTISVDFKFQPIKLNYHLPKDKCWYALEDGWQIGPLKQKTIIWRS